MFCKKCGKSIKDNVTFCPYCGGQINKNKEILKVSEKSNGLMASFLTEEEKGKSQTKYYASGLKKIDKKILFGVICGIIVFVTICIILLLMRKDAGEKREEKEYTVIGEWSSDDLSDLGSILGDAVGGGITGGAVESLIGNALGVATVTFSESGQLYISFYDLSVTFGEVTYEIISNNRMRLAFKFEIPVIGNSVTASYNADYKVSKDTMTLDFFGKKITLDRVVERN